MDQKPIISVSPQIAQEVVVAVQAATMLTEVLKAAGKYEDYVAYNFGSAYYVELPAYLNKLASEGKMEEAKVVAQRCLEGHGIPDDLWKLMSGG